jgi:hypothetical protein
MNSLFLKVLSFGRFITHSVHITAAEVNHRDCFHTSDRNFGEFDMWEVTFMRTCIL